MRVPWTDDLVAQVAESIRGCGSVETAMRKASAIVGVDLSTGALTKALVARGYQPVSVLAFPMQRPAPSPLEIPVYVVDEEDSPPTQPSIRPPPAPLQSLGWSAEQPRERILFVPDCHHPYVDRKAWALMLQCARRFRPTRIIVLGDFVDFYMVSDHDKDPRRASQLDAEIEAGNEALDELDALGAQHKDFVEGNHEARLGRYLMRHAPALLDTVKLPELLRLRERGWSHTPYLAHLRVGDLSVTHACENAGMNAHRQAAGLFLGSVVIGHTHRIAVDQFGAHGKSYTASMFGWLGSSPEASYLSTARKSRYWSLGFGLGWMRSDGTVHTQAVSIVDYAAVVGGEVIRLSPQAA